MGKTKRAPQSQVKSKAHETVTANDTTCVDYLDSWQKDDSGTWQVFAKWIPVDKSGLYVKAKKANDDLEDEYLRLKDQLLSLPPEKEMLKLRRRLVKLDKLKLVAHKAMSDAWWELKNV